MRTRVKFCGCTSREDSALAIQAGADSVGFIFAESPRQLTLDSAREIVATLPPFVTPVGVFADPSREQLDRVMAKLPNLVLQLAGNETPEFVREVIDAYGIPIVKVIHVDPAQVEINPRELRTLTTSYSNATLMFETRIGTLAGGTGVTFAWDIIAPIALERRIGVAGGLTPENVGACVRAVRPYFVDVRTGIETDGKKDPIKMQAFIEAVSHA